MLCARSARSRCARASRPAKTPSMAAASAPMTSAATTKKTTAAGSRRSQKSRSFQSIGLQRAVPGAEVAGAQPVLEREHALDARRDLAAGGALLGAVDHAF